MQAIKRNIFAMFYSFKKHKYIMILPKKKLENLTFEVQESPTRMIGFGGPPIADPGIFFIQKFKVYRFSSWEMIFI